MNITNAKYVKDLVDDSIVYVEATIDNLPMTVPIEPDNRHYAEILKLIAEGTLTIEDAD
tara:strand:- start:363 stop:539 length:177 start_codon:yes stop_codon:yes gene_type:complete